MRTRGLVRGRGSQGADTVRTSLTLERAQWEQVEAIAAKMRVSAAWVLRQAVDAYLGSSPSFRLALEAVRDLKPNRYGALRDYFAELVEDLSDFRMARSSRPFDEEFLENIERFVPMRNEAIALFAAIAQYDPALENIAIVHRFFEQSLKHFERPEEVRMWTDSNADNFRFVVHELLLYFVAITLKYDQFDGADYMLRTPYYLERSPSGAVSFDRFRAHLKTLEERTQRLGLNRISLHADLLRDRAASAGMPFELLMQADFLLFIRDAINAVNQGRMQAWWPQTLLYRESSAPFEMFARSKSASYFEKVKMALGITSKEELVPMLNKFDSNDLRKPRWDFVRVEPAALLNFDNLATVR